MLRRLREALNLVDCRIGSLEMVFQRAEGIGMVDCRIGSLEI